MLKYISFYDNIVQGFLGKTAEGFNYTAERFNFYSF